MNQKSGNKTDTLRTKQIAVTAPSPYPETGGIAPSANTARLLTPLSLDLASGSGEMTAVYQYAYQSILLQARHPALSETLMRIAIVEMHHMNLLGQMMVALGGSPRAVSYFSGRPTPWNGTMPCYTKEPRQMLQADLKAEQDSYHRYRLQAHRISEPRISAVLARLAEDEAVHIRLLEQLLTEW